jgi:hypothetical protein
MKKLLFFIFILFILFVSPSASAQEETASPRYAECDLCGYCVGKEPPSDWSRCQKCIYPQFGTLENANAAENKTVLINPETNLPPKQTAGSMYTQVGCLTTNLPDFTQPGAAASLVTTLLQSVIFPTVGGIAFLYVLYGAFIIATSQANPERLNQGKKTVIGAIIGVVFTIMSIFITNFVASNILKIPGFGN